MEQLLSACLINVLIRTATRNNFSLMAYLLRRLKLAIRRTRVAGTDVRLHVRLLRICRVCERELSVTQEGRGRPRRKHFVRQMYGEEPWRNKMELYKEISTRDLPQCISLQRECDYISNWCNSIEGFVYAMAKFMLTVAVLLIAVAATIIAAPAEGEFEQLELSQGAEEVEDHLRFRRVTCDLLTYQGIVGDSACAANCLSMGKAGGRCSDGVCQCRTTKFVDLWNKRFG